MSSKNTNPPAAPQKVAVIGSGIAGLSAAFALHGKAQATLFEAGNYFGGHANTVDIHIDGQKFGVDTGFLVYNEKTYPGLIGLFENLGVTVAPSDMGFSVQVVGAQRAIEWAGNSLSSVFAQKRSWLSARHWGMLLDILRFNRVATAMVTTKDNPDNQNKPAQTVDEFLNQHTFGAAFIDDYFLPMIACIWSCPVNQMKAYPITALLQFCHNHGLLQITARPQWFTVVGGSRNYVNRILPLIDDKRLDAKVMRVDRDADGVTVHTHKAERFDAVVLACHPDQSLQILGAAASQQEEKVLGAIRYQANEAVLHTDTSVMPQNRKVWAAWNYERRALDSDGNAQHSQVCLHYWLNKLQPLPTEVPILISLNPLRQPDPSKVLARFDYDHPIFDAQALEAQKAIGGLQGTHRTWFAGAWCRYGFHEDGFQAGLAAAQGVLNK